MQQDTESKDPIRRMYLTSNSFKSICHSYQKCSEAIRYWTESDRDEAPERQREYTALLHELELEIMQSLKEGVETVQTYDS